MTKLIAAKLTNEIVGAAIEVHRQLGPGLLESAYTACLARECSVRGISFEMDKHVPLAYKGVKLDCGYRIDFIVEEKVVLELKSVESILPIHEASSHSRSAVAYVYEAHPLPSRYTH